MSGPAEFYASVKDDLNERKQKHEISASPLCKLVRPFLMEENEAEIYRN